MSANQGSLRVHPSWRPDTVAVQAGRPAHVGGAEMNEPIHLTSTYSHGGDTVYGRDGNDGIAALEHALGALDGGTSTAFASGLAAATAIIDLVPRGGTVVVPTAAYFGSRNIFQRLESTGRIAVRPVEVTDIDAVLDALVGADMVWLESIANPLMVVADISTIAPAAKKSGAIVVVDATFATPVRQQPLRLGADIVMHSATKFIGGHSDLLLGVVTCRSAEHAEFVTTYRHDFGAMPGSLETYLALRGLRTLALRVDRAEASAAVLAERLAAHPGVTRVYYPGRVGDSQHEVGKRVLPLGSGPMMAFEVNGTIDQTETFLAGLRLLTHATSLGGVESLIERRARYAGDVGFAPPTLCRFSVGIENVDDLWADLNDSLNASLGLTV